MPSLFDENHAADPEVAPAARPAPTAHTRARPGEGPATAVIEAPTAVAAIAEVRRRHGEGARIVTAEKVRRGGIGGFFAKEHVQLTVDTAAAPAPPLPTRRPTTTPSEPPTPFMSASAASAAAASVPTSSVPTSAAAESSHADPAPSPGDEHRDNPLLTALAGAEDGPAGETFGEMLDRRAGIGASGTAPTTTGLGDTMDRLARATDDEERTFGAALRAAVVADDVAPAPHVADATPAPAAPTAAAAPMAAATGTASLLDPNAGRGAASLATNAEHIAPSPATLGPAPDPTVGPVAATIAEVIGAALSGPPAPVARASDPAVTAPAPVAVAPEPVAPAPQPVAAAPEPFVAAPQPVAAPESLAAAQAPAAAAPAAADTPTSLPEGALSRPEAPSDHQVGAARPEEQLTPTTDGPTSWSAESMAAAGLSDAFVAAILTRSPADDLEWFTAVAREVDAHCGGPLPSAAILVGPGAGEAAAALGSPVVDLDDRRSPVGACTLAGDRTPEARRWLAEERDGRPLHLVVGGAGWREWLGERPAIVSWTDADALVGALGVAIGLGATLGFDLSGDEPRRPRPLDVALAVRERVVGS